MSGCTLYAQAEHSNSTVAGFVIRWIAAIAAGEGGLESEGLYRTQGQRSLTQSVRLQADKGNFAPLAEVENISVLAGAHGLFFREQGAREKLLSPHISSEKTGRMGAALGSMSAPRHAALAAAPPAAGGGPRQPQ